MTDRERLYGGAVLGEVTDIAVGSDGRVYVLDANFYKIVVFSENGAFEGLIIGGQGNGPGEFQRARSLTFGPGGDLWVSDQVSQRITRFTTSGDVISTFPAPMPPILDLAGTSDMVYGERLVRDTSESVVAFDENGHIVALLAPFTLADTIGMTGTGAAPALGAAPGGRLVIAYPVVGMWAMIDGHSVSERRGQRLIPDAIRREHVDDRYGIRTVRVSGQAIQAGAFDSTHTFVMYTTRPTLEDRIRFNLAVFDTGGALIAVADSAFPTARLGHHPNGRYVYTAANEPFPHVVKLEIGGF